MKCFRLPLWWIACVLAFFCVAPSVTSLAQAIHSDPCPVSCEHQDASNSNDSSEHSEHCALHCFCHSVSWIPDATWSLPVTSEEHTLFPRLNETTPDGPVFGIDYPPQRS